MSAPNATHPNTATIPLPPGMNLQQFEALQGKVVTVAIAMAVAVGIACWDFLVNLPEEIAIYRNADKRAWKAPGTYAFIILRYASLITFIPGLFFTSLQSQHCQAAASMGEVGVLLVTGSAGIIFCYRVFSLYQRNKIVYGVVGTLWLFMMGSWLAVATQLRATEGPATAFGSNCQRHPVPNWAPVAFASSVCFDTVVLTLTLLRLKDTVVSSGIGKQLVRDNIMYFVIVTVTNIVVLVINSIDRPDINFIKPVALPYPTLITAAMGTRVYLNLRLFQQRKKQSESLPMTSDIAFKSGLTSGSATLPGDAHSKGVMIVTQQTTIAGDMADDYKYSTSSRY